jgi:hypothetical protein
MLLGVLPLQRMVQVGQRLVMTQAHQPMFSLCLQMQQQEQQLQFLPAMPSCLYKPSTGELQATALVATNGIVVNSQTVSADYTIAAGNNGMSAGTVSVNSGITVTIASGSVWTVI